VSEAKKILYYALGISALVHIIIIGLLEPEAVTWLIALVIVVLIVFLWRATTGRRGALFTGLGLAICILAIAWAVVFYSGLDEDVEREKLIRFQAPPPILEKNFDLAKQPEISEVQMEMLASMGPPDIPPDITGLADVTAVGSDLLGSVLPSTQILGAFSGAKAEELSFDQVEMVQLSETSAPVQEALSLRQELLNVGDLDYGRYQAILIQDPENKKNIRGFFNMTIIDYDLADKNADRFPTAVEELMRYIRDYSKINARIEGTTIRLSDRNLAKAPFIYLTGNNAIFQFTDAEKESLGEYLRGGGFLFADEIRKADPDEGLAGKDAGVIGTSFDRQFKALLKDPLVLGNDGDKWQKIPKDHDLFFAFFEFRDGPPMGGAPGGNVFDLEMLELRGRVAVIFSDLNISWYWGDPNADARERGLQFGVNLIVYSLTQPGGIANVSQFTE
jgi:hypothetical protein